MIVADKMVDTRYNVNENVNPGNDFYKYVCDSWQKEHPLPKAYGRYSVFHLLNDENEKKIFSILNELSKKELEEGSIEQKIRDLYTLGMDMKRRNADGIKDLKNIISEIENAKTIKDLRDIQYKYPFMNFSLLMHTSFSSDDKNSDVNICNVWQGGLSLPEKNYYLSDDTSMQNIREEFKKHIVKMFKIFGFNENIAQKKMSLIFNAETECAKISRSQEELRDPIKNYNKMSLDDFVKKYPNIPLVEFYAAKGVDKKYLEELVVGQPEFLTGVDEKMKNQSVDELKSLMEFDLICSFASYLNDEVIDANFNFFGKILSGKKEKHPLQKRVLNQLEGYVGNAISKLFCERFFPESSKNKMLNLVEYLQTAFAERILAQTWMSEKTKLKALGKLSSMKVKIGYPDKWDDFSELKVDKNKSYFLNILECVKFLHDKKLKEKVGQPVDKEKWLFDPHIVNACYEPNTNTICFPAGILQPPFFNPQADDAENFGAIGAVIGHEMTHGFDDQGRLFDKDGNMESWWSEEEEKAFREKNKVCEDFFDKIEVLPNLHANGKLTLGENIADHGGVKIAFTALKKIMKGKSLGVKNGFTPEQRFFISFAILWACNETEEIIRLYTNLDPHSLPCLRVNGCLAHIDEWYEAFDIKETDKLFIKKEDRFDIW